MYLNNSYCIIMAAMEAVVMVGEEVPQNLEGEDNC